MTTETNPDPTGAQAQGSAQTGAAQGVGTTASGQFAAQGYEGSQKQNTDIGSEEAAAIIQSLAGKDAMFHSTNLTNNAKRTSDEAQTNDLMVRLGDIAQRDRLNNLATQALQNAIESANMVSKQAIRHADLAIDRQWNPDEQGYQIEAILRNDTFKDAIAGAVAAAVAAAVTTK